VDADFITPKRIKRADADDTLLSGSRRSHPQEGNRHQEILDFHLRGALPFALADYAFSVQQMRSGCGMFSLLIVCACTAPDRRFADANLTL
jgi:hypothetical protein